MSRIFLYFSYKVSYVLPDQPLIHHGVSFTTPTLLVSNLQPSAPQYAILL